MIGFVWCVLGVPTEGPSAGVIWLWSTTNFTRELQSTTVSCCKPGDSHYLHHLHHPHMWRPIRTLQSHVMRPVVVTPWWWWWWPHINFRDLRFVNNNFQKSLELSQADRYCRTVPHNNPAQQFSNYTLGHRPSPAVQWHTTTTTTTTTITSLMLKSSSPFNRFQCFWSTVAGVIFIYI